MNKELKWGIAITVIGWVFVIGGAWSKLDNTVSAETHQLLVHKHEQLEEDYVKDKQEWEEREEKRDQLINKISTDAKVTRTHVEWLVSHMCPDCPHLSDLTD